MNALRRHLSGHLSAHDYASVRDYVATRLTLRAYAAENLERAGTARRDGERRESLSRIRYARAIRLRQQYGDTRFPFELHRPGIRPIHRSDDRRRHRHRLRWRRILDRLRGHRREGRNGQRRDQARKAESKQAHGGRSVRRTETPVATGPTAHA